MEFLKTLSPEAYAAIGVCFFFGILIYLVGHSINKENQQRHGYTSRRKDREQRLGRRKP